MHIGKFRIAEFALFVAAGSPQGRIVGTDRQPRLFQFVGYLRVQNFIG